MALFNLINDRLAHCGELHDIPRDPHDTVRKDEVEFRHPDDRMALSFSYFAYSQLSGAAMIRIMTMKMMIVPTTTTTNTHCIRAMKPPVKTGKMRTNLRNILSNIFVCLER